MEAVTCIKREQSEETQVPACAHCDDSKRHPGFEEWMTSDIPGLPKSRGVKDVDQMVEHIKAYIQYFGHTSRSLEERLDEHGSERLMTVRSRLQELKKDIEALVKGCRMRPGNT